MNSEKNLGEIPLASVPHSIRRPTSAFGSRSARRGALVAVACIAVAATSLLTLLHMFSATSAWPQGWLNPFDAGVVRSVNRLASWHWLNRIVGILSEHNLLKDGPVVFLFWIAFFPRSGSAEKILETRKKIASTVSLALCGVVLARILAMVVPFRERPLRTVALHFQSPHIVRQSVLYGWSSFPSDHATLLVTLAAGLLIASRPLGAVTLVYTFAVNLFLRVYLGLHWPTDLIAGTLIGIGLASIVNIAAYRNFIWRQVAKCWQVSPGLCAAFLFFLSYEVVDMFEGPLTLAKTLLKHHLR